MNIGNKYLVSLVCHIHRTEFPEILPTIIPGIPDPWKTEVFLALYNLSSFCVHVMEKL